MNVPKLLGVCSVVIIFIILVITYFHPIAVDIVNSDIGRHLLLGKIIWITGNVPKTNLLTSSLPNYPFVNSHWLSEVVFYLIHTFTGFNGLIAFSILLICLTFSIEFIPSVQQFGLLPTTIVSLLYIQVLSERTEVRPEIFSFFFLAIFMLILDKYRQKFTNWVLILIPIELLWVNFHIYFFVGIAVLLFYSFDALISDKGRVSKKTLWLLLVTLCAGLAILCNPNFVRGAMFPLYVLNNFGFSIRENADLLTAIRFYNKPTFTFFIVAVLMLWISMLLSARKMNPIDYFLALFFTFTGFFGIRNFPLFVFGTFLPCAAALSYVIDRISTNIPEKKRLHYATLLFSLTIVASIPSFAWNIENHGLGLGVIDNADGAISFLSKNNIKGNIYNNFDIGNYLDYRLYPNQKAFVDNRPEAYPKDFFKKIYFPMQTSSSLFAEATNTYKFDIVIFAHTDITSQAELFMNNILSSQDWKMVYLDSIDVMFLKDTSRNKPVIEKFLITKDHVKIKNDDLKDSSKVAQLQNLFKAIRWENQQLAMNLRYLSLKPDDCSALQNAIYLLEKQKNSAASVYSSKYRLFCK